MLRHYQQLILTPALGTAAALLPLYLSLSLFLFLSLRFSVPSASLRYLYSFRFVPVSAYIHRLFSTQSKPSLLFTKN